MTTLKRKDYALRRAPFRGPVPAAARQSPGEASASHLRGGEALGALEAPMLGSRRASPEEGRIALISAEGGCVGIGEARRLFRKPRPVSARMLSRQIGMGNVISYRMDGRLRVPVWQFRPKGGLLNGLPEILRALRRIPGAGQMTPFTFFLQADPVTDCRTPLALLKEGKIRKVLDAADVRAGYAEPSKSKLVAVLAGWNLKSLRETRAAVVAAFKRDLMHRSKFLVLLKSFDAENVARTVTCLNSRAAAASWLTRPQHGLNGLVPVKMKIDSRTKAQILNLLGRIEHGVF